MDTVRAWDFLHDFVHFAVVVLTAFASLGGGHFTNLINSDSHFPSHDIEHGVFGLFTVSENTVFKVGFPLGVWAGHFAGLDDIHALHGIHQTGAIILGFLQSATIWLIIALRGINLIRYCMGFGASRGENTWRHFYKRGEKT